MKIEIPVKVKRIIDRLRAAGFEAYAVGGCVRDSVLGRKPEDWDITTSAKPEQVKAIFKRTIDTGIQHGTVTVLEDREGFEVTTYRIDGEYEDGRHPKQVEFTADIIEDLKRRDFTINAMAYNEEEGLIDAFSGLEDLRRQKIRCVGEPTERFNEDALRMLRAVRFSAQLGFSIEDNTKKAIKDLAPNLRRISEERIQVEIVKLLMSERPEKWQEVSETGIGQIILPEYEALPAIIKKRALRAAGQIRADKALRLTALLHGLPDTKVKEILQRLRFDNHTIRIVCKLVLWQLQELPPDPFQVRRCAAQLGAELFGNLLELKQALVSEAEVEEKKDLDQVEAVWAGICQSGDCISLKMLQVKGSDLLAAGITRGSRIGEVLGELLEHVLEYPEHNEKEYLLKLVEQKSNVE